MNEVSWGIGCEGMRAPPEHGSLGTADYASARRLLSGRKKGTSLQLTLEFRTECKGVRHQRMVAGAARGGTKVP